MRVAAALLLFLATIANAQTVDPHEEVYGPFEPGPTGRAPALAVAPQGMLLVWSEIDPKTKSSTIRTGLLNFDGKLAGPINTIPTMRDKVHATNPVVATDGTTFYIAWLETYRYSAAARDVVGVLTDGAGKPLQSPQFVGTPVQGAPALVWNGLEYRVFDSASYAISTTGEVHAVDYGEAPRRVPFATPAANGWIDWSNVAARPASCPFFLCGGQIPATPAAYNLDFAILSADWIRAGRIREAGYNSGPPAVNAHGDDLLIVWGTPQGLKAARLENGETVTNFELRDALAADATPSLAQNLVVFERSGDVYGTVIDGNSFGPIFPISAGEQEWDAEPHVYQTGERRYLVTYIREGDGPDISLVSRFVTVP